MRRELVKKHAAVIAAVVAALLLAQPSWRAVAAESLLVEAIVNRVIDGSSLDAHLGGVQTAVGYLGAETPQLNERCGQQALARNRELAAQRVLVEDDPTYQFDSVGRRLYYVYTPLGQSIDEALIYEGLARAVRLDAAHGSYLAGVEADARAAARGCLWGA